MLDLLDLLLQVASEAGEGEDDVLLDVLGLARLGNGVLVVAAQELQGIVDAGRVEEAGRGVDVVGDIGELDEGL